MNGWKKSPSTCESKKCMVDSVNDAKMQWKRSEACSGRFNG